MTVLQEIVRQLPSESIIYYGDTGRLPYGPRPREEIQGFALEIGNFLVDQGVKVVAVACSTATAAALPALQAELAAPVLGVIESGAAMAVRATRNKRVGVIGTEHTIASGAYQRAVAALDDEIEVLGQPCPLLAPMIEEGKKDTPEMREQVLAYLAPLGRLHIDTLVFGCTHYPVLAPLVREALGPSVALVDPAVEMAHRVRRLLEERELTAPATQVPRRQFFVSARTEQFRRVGETIMTMPWPGEAPELLPL